ncbi:MAG: Transcriptional regulator [Bacteroidetes bacterium]|nr:Transcriptional regulator [Bacteroidota bacterium]
MNLQQLEYIIAVDEHRHFARAAEHSFVTQPTLSMMIQKLEEELGLKIFDRSKHPIEPTQEGEEIIRRAKAILSEAAHLRDYSQELKGEITGDLHIGIIPTLAPYLLPMCLKNFSERFPKLRLHVREMITDEIVAAIKAGKTDMGLLATPVNEPNLTEHVLFYEAFYAYVSSSEKLPNKKYLLPKQINPDHLWLLEEGHCLRSQIYNLCELKHQSRESDTLHYEAGSIETLINLVDRYDGITIIPHLAVLNLKPSQKKKVREFSNPKPVREISLVTKATFPRGVLLQRIQEEIIRSLPSDINPKNRNVLPISDV